MNERAFRTIAVTLGIIMILFTYNTLKFQEDFERTNRQNRIDIDTMKGKLSNMNDDIIALEEKISMIDNKGEIYEVTGYCHCVKCCGKTDGITASGNAAQENITVAMDQNIPFGTIVYIEWLGFREVQDRGSAIKGKRIDVYFSRHKDALEFGKRNLLVEIVK